MKHSTYTTNDSAKLKTGPGSSAPLLCGVRKTSIVASRYYLVFPALYLASMPLVPEGRAGIAWDHQSSKFSVSHSNRYSASRHTLLLPPPPLSSPLLVLFILPLLLFIVHFCVHYKRQPIQQITDYIDNMLAAVRSICLGHCKSVRILPIRRSRKADRKCEADTFDAHVNSACSSGPHPAVRRISISGAEIKRAQLSYFQLPYAAETGIFHERICLSCGSPQNDYRWTSILRVDEPNIDTLHPLGNFG